MPNTCPCEDVTRTPWVPDGLSGVAVLESCLENGSYLLRAGGPCWGPGGCPLLQGPRGAEPEPRLFQSPLGPLTTAGLHRSKEAATSN